LTDEELQQWVERISLDCFGKPFRHRAVFNRRLTTTGGRYFTRTHHIEISWRHYLAFGREEIEKIIKHELCHYHLHLERKGFRHRDADFRRLLERVGGSLHCRSVSPRRSLPYRYELVCRSCGMRYPRRRKMNPARYACGRCGGRLSLRTVASAPATDAGETPRPPDRHGKNRRRENRR